MVKGSSGRQISRPGKNNDGCIWSMFCMFDFQEACNSQRLLANGVQYGNIASDCRYSSDALDLPFEIAEKDTDSIIDGQDGAENDTFHRHDEISVDEKISEVQQAETGSEKNKKVLACRGLDGSSINMRARIETPGTSSRLDCYDLAVLTNNGHSSCPIHSPRGKSCDGVQLATLLQETLFDENKDQGLECRRNSHFGASANTSMRDVCDPKQQDAKLNKSEKLQWDACDKLFHVEEEMTTTPEAPHQSDELLGTVKVMDSNKGLLYQLLQDPHSKMTEHVEKLKNSHGSDHPSVSVRCKSPEKQNTQPTFQKEKKDRGQKVKGSIKPIVVLKPLSSKMECLSISRSSITSTRSSRTIRTCGDSGSKRTPLSFTFQELKRRLRHAMGEKKQRKTRSSDEDIQEGGELTSCDVQKHFSAIPSCHTKSEHNVEIQDNNNSKGHHLDMGKIEEERVICNMQRESNFERKAKKHLREMLHSKDDCEDRQEKSVSKALWHVLSPQDHSFSPLCNSGRHESLSAPLEMRFSHLLHPTQQGDSETLDLTRHPESQVCSSANTDAKSFSLDSGSELVETKSEDGHFNIEVADLEGTSKVVDTELCGNNSTPDEISDHVNDGMTGLDETDAPDEIQSPRSDSAIEIKTSTHPASSTLLIPEKEVQEIIVEKMGRPSPVSVLIPPFMDDPTSSNSPVSEQREEVGLPMSPRELQFDNESNKSAEVLTAFYSEGDQRTPIGEEEFKFEYVGSLLDASGLIHLETWEKRQSRNLLDPSLFDEVEVPFGDIPCDIVLLFDYICEVLEGIRKKCFPCKPWATFTNKNLCPFPCRESLIQEVCEKTSFHHATWPQSNLDQFIEKDLDANIWMGTSAEIDDMGVAIEDEILEDSLEELVLDFFN